MVHPPYREVFWLILLAHEAWERIDGEAALAGRDYLSEHNLRRFLNLVEVWYLKRVEHDDEALASVERILEDRTPLDKAAYAGLVGRGPGKVASDATGWFDLASHGSGG